MAKTGADAIVALPCSVSFAMNEAGCGRWLARSMASRQPVDCSALQRVLAELSLPAPETGLAGLRYWGQTGAPPSGWLAGADPVWLQAGLDKLYLHAPAADDLDAETLSELMADLQEAMFADDQSDFEALGNFGYLHSPQEFATSSLPADAISGTRPDPYLPSGASATRYLQLCGEIQLALHDHRSNLQREQRGQPPVNSLWLWGGGTVDGHVPRTLPALFANEPLMRGYWWYSQASVSDWPGSLSQCATVSEGRFVAVVPPPVADVSVDAVATALRELQALQANGRLPDIALLFMDGTVLRVRRSEIGR
ncbi:MAG: hypothetical protein RIA65_12070, partial [Woeseia sp.]